MSNAVAVGVGQDRFYRILWDFKLYGNFGGAYTIVKIIHDCAGGQARTAKHWDAALHVLTYFDKRAP